MKEQRASTKSYQDTAINAQNDQLDPKLIDKQAKEVTQPREQAQKPQSEPKRVVQEFEENDRSLWRNKSFFQDITQTWQNKFVAFAFKAPQIRKENLMELSQREHAHFLYSDLQRRQAAIKNELEAKNRSYVEREMVAAEIKRLTIQGILKYGFILCLCETSTLGSILCFKYMIDYLKDPDAHSISYSIFLYCMFAFLRLITILCRSYYDMHVYTYFRFVQTKVQCWLFELTCELRQWQILDSKKAQVINVLTKDTDLFVNSSWKLPYLVTVPINTILSAIFLYWMFGPVIFVCYVVMAALLAMQIFTNNFIAKKQYIALTIADKRVQLLSQVLKGIRTIKCRVLEPLFAQRIDKIRAEELKAFSVFADFKTGTSAIYFNAGVIISAILFLITDKKNLDLGKVFSTLALLGYIFNFSIVNSNYAVESIFSLAVFRKRIEAVITEPLLSKGINDQNRKLVKDCNDDTVLEFQNVSISWTVPTEQKACESYSNAKVKPMEGPAETNRTLISEEYDPENVAIIRDASFKLKRGENVAVIGAVGTGKTSLLMAILGEMPIQSGTFLTDQTAQDIVFAEQEPLIVTGTVESNILFGLEMDTDWYAQVISACCLEEDFAAFPSGDQTKLGEMGHTISGGQKSRLSLARALYRKSADIILIDCTLGSLDQKTSKKVMERAILGLCADKLLIYATHDLEQAAQMDKIILIQEEKVAPEVLSQQQFLDKIEELRVRIKNPFQIKEGADEQFNSEATAGVGASDNQDQQVIKEELIEAGKIGWREYRDYLRLAYGGLCGILLIVFLHVLINLCSLAVSIFLAFSLTEKFTTDETLTEDEKQHREKTYNVVLISIIVFALLSAFLGKFLSNRIFMGINRRLHDQVTRRVLNAHISFFEENTQGRILNRFSKDVATLDHLVFCILDFADYMIKTVIALITMAVVVPWLIIVAVFSFCYLMRVRARCVTATRDPIRLKVALLSPVNSLIQDAVNGLPTLRCLGMKQHFMERIFLNIDDMMRAFITSCGGHRWTALRIDVQAYLISMAFSAFAMFIEDSKRSPEKLALTAIGLQMTIEITRLFDFAIRWSVDVETEMISVQRLQALTRITSERTATTQIQHLQDYPYGIGFGEIKFQNVELRYKPELNPALNNLSFKVKPGDTVAVVGRTGAGKSSIYQLLLGFRDANKGTLQIDGRDVNQLDLCQLRSQINVVLQNPFVVMSDTIRQNLDPHGLYSDLELTTALQDAAIHQAAAPSHESMVAISNQSNPALEISKSPSAGKTQIELGTLASDLSIGQQQLLNLAQALLQKKCRILLLDEPTAQVDYKSQAKVLANLFKMCKANKITVLMIAHRLETAATYCDKVLVLDQGSVTQYGESNAICTQTQTYDCTEDL